MAAPESMKGSVPNDSVAMSHIPVLMGVFLTYKAKSNFTEGRYSNLLTELKEDLKKRDIPDFDHLIDQLSTKFELFFDDEDLPDRIKEQIARLQIYLFMSSIQESNLLKRSSNPARRLLDTVIRTEVDFVIDEQEDLSGYEYLREQIDLFSNNPFVDSDTYGKLLEGYVQHTTEKSSAKSKQNKPKKVKADVQPIKPAIKVPQAAIKEVKLVEKPAKSVKEPVEEVEVKAESGQESITESMVEAVVKAVAEPVPVAEKLPLAENVYPVIQSMVNDMTLPLRVQGRSLILFDEVWSPLLLEVAITKGFKSRAWQKILTIAKTQVWVLTPKSSEQELTKLLTTIKQIEKSLSQSMQSLKLSIDQQASLLEFLEHEQADVIAQSKATIEKLKKARDAAKNKTEKKAPIEKSGMPQKDQEAGKVNLADTVDEFSDLMETGRFENSNDMLQALNSEKTAEFKAIKVEDLIPSADKIHKSDWIEIKKGATTVLAKLTWKSADETQFIFVDREGNRVCEISRDDLNKQLKSGSITLISSTPSSAKRASYSVIQTIK